MKLTKREKLALKAFNSNDREQCRAYANTTLPTPSGDRYHVSMHCYVYRLSYNWDTKRGDIWCGGCTDMEGAIAVFEAIDINVQTIMTYWDGRPDTSYRRDPSGSWQAYTSRSNACLDVSL